VCSCCALFVMQGLLLCFYAGRLPVWCVTADACAA
jgi:hypothetical protein